MPPWAGSAHCSRVRATRVIGTQQGFDYVARARAGQGQAPQGANFSRL
ncbi:hypothetical protein AAH678_23305 [Sodalis endosymbiont of Spalangia cameroni]